MNNVLRSAIVLVIRVFVLLAITLLLFQRKLIYHPRSYSPELMAAASAKPLRYKTSEGEQVAWVARESLKDAKTVWLITCGNGTCGLDLVNYFESMTEMAGDAFVFFDYPGYGASQGVASPAAIRESIKALVPAVAERLHQPVDELKPKLRVWGHSMGAAAALMAMEEHGIKRGVLIAPFYTMMDMAKRVVGWPLCLILRHRFDNALAMENLRKRGGYRVDVIHGTDDEVIPHSQGRKLATAFPEVVRFESAEGARHNDILGSHRSRIIAAMLRCRE